MAIVLAKYFNDELTDWKPFPADLPACVSKR